MIKDFISSVTYIFIKGLLLSYPLITTALVIKKPRSTELLHWMIFWSLLGLINLSETILSIIPFYYVVELFLIFILQNELMTRFIKRYIITMFMRDFRWFYSNKFVEYYIYTFLVKYKIIGFLESYYNFISAFNNNPLEILTGIFNRYPKNN